MLGCRVVYGYADKEDKMSSRLVMVVGNVGFEATLKLRVPPPSVGSAEEALTLTEGSDSIQNIPQLVS